MQKHFCMGFHNRFSLQSMDYSLLCNYEAVTKIGKRRIQR